MTEATPSCSQFQHHHAAHCESGVASALLTNAGMPISEAMAFGLSSALTFAHLPYPRVNGFPLTSYRLPPGMVIGRLCRRLGVRMRRERFRNADAGMRALDEYLDAGRPVGLQTSVYWLPYFPPDMRFHFNAHNLVVFGREGDDYLISDPVFEEVQHCPAADLRRARSVKGLFAPRNLIYYPRTIRKDPDWTRMIRASLRASCNMMLRTPVPLIGVRGIHRLARKLRKLPGRQDPRWARMYVAQIIRMQEEIGTGGGGFRFMYAAFLEEAAERLGGHEALLEAADSITRAGDGWRDFAAAGALLVQDRSGVDYPDLADRLEHCAELESEAFTLLDRSFR